MSYCLNPHCQAPADNPARTSFCISCGGWLELKHRYRAQKLLGQGGFGKTFKAVDEHQPSKPPCVIKQFEFGSNNPQIRETALKLFYDEARHLESLGKHHNIPELLAYFDIEGQPYLIQQFIDGQDLEQELATAGVFDQSKIRKLLLSFLPVLDFLHTRLIPVIHRDIKPANIIRRCSDDSLVLVDFGAAKQATKTMLGKTGTLIGSPEYTAPEQIRGKPTFASDIYSLGVTCIYLLTQVSPFDLFDINQDAWVWRDYLVNNPVDEELGRVLDRMIANSLPQRYQSATDVLAALGNSQPAVNQASIPQNSNTLDLTSPYGNINFDNFTKIQAKPLNSQQSLQSLEPETAQIQLNNSTEVQAKLPHNSRPLESFEFEIAKIRIEELGGLWGHTKVVIEKLYGQSKQFVEDFGDGVNLEMVAVPGGSFFMGAPESELESNDNERPQHQVQVPPFYMSKYVITIAQYQTVMRDRSYTTDEADLHMRCEWKEALAFCEKLSKGLKRNYRLPSEAEWEYACRAGTTTPFYFGETINKEIALYDASRAYGRGEKCENYRSNRGFRIKVGSFPANTYGLYDMHGHVEEWCADSCHENYTGAPTDGSAWVSDNSYTHIARGGKYDSSPEDCRSAARNLKNSYGFYGFRVVCC